MARPASQRTERTTDMKRKKTTFRWMAARREIVTFFRRSSPQRARAVFPHPDMIEIGLTA